MSEFPNGQPAPARYTRSALFPQRIHRILDTTAQIADALRGINRNRHPDAIRFHRICALVWLFRVRRAFGGYWRLARPWVGSRVICRHLYLLHSVVASCYDSALMKLVRTPPFRDVQADERLADQTLRWDPALFDDRRYRLLTDEDLAYVTRRIEKSANHIRDRVSDLRHAVWEELDRVQNCPPSPITRTADEVVTFFRSDRWHNVAPWRETAYQFRTTSEAKAQREGRTLKAPADAPVVLKGPDKKVILWGNLKPPLTPAQYGVVKALVDAHAANERLSKTQLEKQAKDARGNPIEDPLGALERLCKKDPDWKKAIDMAGTPGRGYSQGHRILISTSE